MSGVKKMIYIPSQKIWDEIKEEAKDDGRSASSYLVWLHRVNVGAIGLRRAGDAAGGVVFEKPKKLYE